MAARPDGGFLDQGSRIVEICGPDAATFQAIREQLGTAERPAYYLAIPPTLFGLVVEQLARRRAAKRLRCWGLSSRADEVDAYERVLGDAMQGDPTLFAREDYVEEAWRIVDPVLKDGTPVYEYEQGTWGPTEVDSRVSPRGGWQNPTVHLP